MGQPGMGQPGTQTYPPATNPQTYPPPANLTPTNPANPYRTPPYSPQPTRPNHLAAPQHPAIQPRVPAPPATPPLTPAQRAMQPMPVPLGFPLTPQQQAYLDQVLQFWEFHGKQVKKFSCGFTRWEYDGGDPRRPRNIDQGIIKYGTPDRGLFHVQKAYRDGRWGAIEPMREDHWVCDGQSVSEINHHTKQAHQFILPPEMRGKAIQNSPLPFLFGAEAENLKRRYYLRVMQRGQGQIWLEAYPRFQADASSFRRAELILAVSQHDIEPKALQLFLNDQNRTAYEFRDIKKNAVWPQWPSPFSVPRGWTTVVDDSRARVGQQPNTPPLMNR